MSTLRIKNTYIEFIPEFFFSLYSCNYYLSLYLDLGNLQVFGKHDLDQFVNLKSLKIIANNLIYLHRSCFRRLVQLEILDLEANKLTVIPIELFSKLSLLRNVKLIVPRVYGFLTDFFGNNRRLESVKVSTYRLGITEQLLEQSSNVQILHCVSEVPSIITYMITENQLTNLTNLKLERLFISDFPFNNFKNLTRFSLSDGLLSGYSVASIFQIENLRIVSLKRNKLFNSVAFEQGYQLNRLVYLDLSQNNFTSNCRQFNHMFNLSVLNLSSNLLRVITFDLFSGFENLKILNLSNNIINVIEDNAFENLTCLEVINLNCNVILEFWYKHFQAMKRLRRLHLISNVVRVLEYVPITNYDCLVQVIDVSDNLIESIGLYFFWPMTNLTYLNLNMNSIEHLCRCHFQTLSLLQYLDLSFNLINTINDDLFADLKCLKSLKLSDNFIEELHGDVFKTLINLCVLDLSSNKIATIPDRLFQSNRKLKHLLLNNNKLTMLSEDIFSYACFDCVDLTHNSINYRSIDAFLRVLRIDSCFVVDNEIGAILMNFDTISMYKIVIR